MTTESKTALLSDSVYNFLKPVTTIVLPAAGSLYFGLAGIWNLPNADKVVGTIAVLTTFFGVILGLSTKSYNNSDSKYDGTLEVHETPEKIAYLIDVTKDPVGLARKTEVTLKVQEK